jgi:hypothetical protein
VSRFTETLEAHGWNEDDRVDCLCGAVFAVSGPDLRTLHAAHVESMLVEAGVVAVELPEADEVGDGFETWNGREVTATIGSGKVRCYLEDPRMTADDARELAAALLAASAAAVRPVTPEEPR